jgi:phenylpropionate dioxygenase-like ring-hydroxylating dioxygenase large terminal subunit
VHIDAIGFVWVNLNSKNEVPWKAEFEGVDTQARFEGFNFDEYQFDHTWEMSGDYNWKTLSDNYNECYHCPTAHPDAAALADLKLYSVDTKDGHIQHYANLKQAVENEGFKICSTFYFPNACMTISYVARDPQADQETDKISPHFMYMMRCVPTSAHHCSMEYEVYRHKDAPDEAYNEIDAMFKRILGEDKWLCNNAQKNLDAGVFVNGEMHSRMEKGPLFLQDTVRKLVKAHHEREKELKREVWPARQQLPGDATGSAEDESFCASLACDSDAAAKIQW